MNGKLELARRRRLYYLENREAYLARARRQWEAIKADPERHERYKAKRREVRAKERAIRLAARGGEQGRGEGL